MLHTFGGCATRLLCPSSNPLSSCCISSSARLYTFAYFQWPCCISSVARLHTFISLSARLHTFSGQPAQLQWLCFIPFNSGYATHYLLCPGFIPSTVLHILISQAAYLQQLFCIPSYLQQRGCMLSVAWLNTLSGLVKYLQWPGEIPSVAWLNTFSGLVEYHQLPG